MRFLTDENIPTLIVDMLQRAGHDVVRDGDVRRAAPDTRVLKTAVDDDRVLITFDADFGRMIFAEGYRAPRGVIYLRSPPPSIAIAGERILAVIDAETPAIDGYFVSIERKRASIGFPT